MPDQQEEQNAGFNANITTQGQDTGNPVTNVNVQIPQGGSNGVGVAGFVLALIALFLSWVPVFGWILWVLGAILSIVGLFRVPRGLAIAGTVISFIDVIILIAVIGVIGGCAALML